MEKYEKFKKMLSSKKEKDYRLLRREIKAVESAIEKFLEKALECTSVMAEKDFLVSSI